MDIQIFKVMVTTVVIGSYSAVVPRSKVLIHLVFWSLAFYIGLNIIYISYLLFGQIAQWLERVHGMHEVENSIPTRANFLYGIEKP